jgi:hypothetical protein
MTRIALALIILAAASAPAQAVSDLDVLPQGQYGCWTAGSATGPALTDTPPTFTIVRGSSYESAAGGGTYLLASDLLTFTRGPLKDMRLRRTREGFWQQIARDGEFGRLKCSRRGGAPLT